MNEELYNKGIETYKTLIASQENTVLARYTPLPKTETHYQSEAELEKKLIKDLQSQGYEYAARIKNEAALIANLRTQLGRLNNINFTDREWERVLNTITKTTDKRVDKTRRIQEEPYQDLKCDDDSLKNIYLIDKKNIHNNSLQVITQYQAKGIVDNRYDVSILVNGLPLVHIELKRRGDNKSEEASLQIERYQAQSFGYGMYQLFNYVQLFVISNGTETKYFSNSTHQNEPIDKFTLFWADAQNIPIRDLEDFTRTFFLKGTLLNILTRYCVFMTDNTLKVMRPYQIVAVERILHKINCSILHPNLLGTRDAGGYIWHTMGSGKTLTSFQVARLTRTVYPKVEKVILVVDRQDLDIQTVQEYNKIQFGVTNAISSTAHLEKVIQEENDKIIVTTIQKLSSFIKKYKQHEVYQKHIVLIFDECHRSQFGSMHRTITERFKKYNVFGFTGTPIFEQNSNKATAIKSKEKTTNTTIPLAITTNVFGQQLHAYTINDALRDKKVLPCKITYYNTFDAKPEEAISEPDKPIRGVDKPSVWLDDRRIKKVAKYILQHFDTYTRRNENEPRVEKKRKTGFNALFATFSIEGAKKYYKEFAEQQKHLSKDKKLRIAVIYSQQIGQKAEPEENTDKGPKNVEDIEFLNEVLKEYNRWFKSNYVADKNFKEYFQDVSKKIKKNEIDLCIVVDMLLTGFDALTLNTLFVDKFLKHHRLIQAFSRTNRIYNELKEFGNIVCFLKLDQEIQEAVDLFSDPSGNSKNNFIVLKKYEEYYQDYTIETDILLLEFDVNKPLETDEEKVAFVKLFNKILRIINILNHFTEFTENQHALTERQMQDYKGIYQTISDEFKRRKKENLEWINNDLVFELEFLKQSEITLGGILETFREDIDDLETTKELVVRDIEISPTLRPKRDLLKKFIDEYAGQSDIDEKFNQFIPRERDAELQQIIAEENLIEEKTKEFIQRAFDIGYVQTYGMDITHVLPKYDHGYDLLVDGYHVKKKRVIDKIERFFERYYAFGLFNE